MVPSSGSSSPSQDLEQRGLPAPVGSHQADANARRESQVQVLKQPAPAECLPDAFGLNQALGLSIGRREVDLCRCRAAARRDGREFLDQPSGGVDSRARLAGPGFRSSPKPLHFAPHLRRQRILLLGLRLEKLLPPLQKLAVVPLHLERALRIDRVDLHHLRGDVLEKVPVVGDHQAGVGGLDRALEPQDAFQVQVIGGLVQKQHVRRGHQRRRDGEALPPSAGERRGRCARALEAGPAEHHLLASGLLLFLQGQTRQAPP